MFRTPMAVTRPQYAGNGNRTKRPKIPRRSWRIPERIIRDAMPDTVPGRCRGTIRTGGGTPIEDFTIFDPRGENPAAILLSRVRGVGRPRSPPTARGAG